MKAAEFDYIRAATLAEACEAIADADDGAERKIIAGGQTLVPLMAMRLARPTLLVDINDIDELHGITADTGQVAIRGCTRQRRAEQSAELRDRLPLLAKALPFVGHWQTRNRGTVGGSIACADPSAEIPLVALTLDAEITARSAARGERSIAARDFFVAAMVTALAPDECLTEIRFPVWPADGAVGTGFHEVSSRRSDFAIAAAAAQVALDNDGICRRIALAVGGVAPTPLRLDDVAARLVGARLDDAAIAAAVAEIPGLITPDGDVHASADYRRRVAGVLAGRALGDARDAALGKGAAA